MDESLDLGDEAGRGNVIEDAIARALRAAGGTPAAASCPDASRALLQQLLEAAGGAAAAWAEADAEPPPPGPPGEVAVPVTIDGAAQLGGQLASLGLSAAAAAHETLMLVRGLEDALEERGVLSAEVRRRLRSSADAAAERMLTAHNEEERRRRDGWLSYYAHQLRNPLNTLVNAVWLLRNGDTQQKTQRICDMAERAVSKLEATIKDVRDVETHFSEEPPLKAALRGK